jgi:acetyltransferase-like isoleucine patch superfamily enzyme
VIIGPDHAANFHLKYPEKLSIGDYTCINGDCYIHALGGVKIGSYCHIAKGMTIFSHNHNWKSCEFIPYDDKDIMKPVTIGEAVWIGANVTIAPGTKIGSGAIISTASAVFGEIPECAIIRGNPAVIVGYRDKETYYQLYSSGRLK